jgi:hypothetical protein
LLRGLRDKVSATSTLGARLIDAIYDEYFQFSPRIANQLRQDDVARDMTLQMVVRPLLAWYTLAGKLGLESGCGCALGQATQDVIDACPAEQRQHVLELLNTVVGSELTPRLANMRFAPWAILEPLKLAWTSDGGHASLTEAMAQWLARAPFEALPSEAIPSQLEAELAVLSRFLAFRPAARQPMGQRLLAAWPHAAAALTQAGFLPHEPVNEKEQ